MERQHIIVKQEGPVTRITLNRPEKRNPLSLALMLELTAALEDAEGQVVVLEGAGPAFSAGHDLAELRGADLARYQHIFGICTKLMETIQSIPQPVIAKVHGIATAAGCGPRPGRVADVRLGRPLTRSLDGSLTRSLDGSLTLIG